MDKKISRSAAKDSLVREGRLHFAKIPRKNLGDSTRIAKASHVRVLANAISRHFRIHSFAQLHKEMVYAVFDDLMCERSVGTAQNLATVLRDLIAAAGAAELAASPELDNESLGCAGRSRDGTHVPLAPEEIDNLLTAAERVDMGVRLALEICFRLGLRVQEALTAPKSFATWIEVLSSGDEMLDIRFGTKTGRERRCRVFDVAVMLELLHRAAKYSEAHGGWLIKGVTRDEAISRFYRVTRSIGMIGERSPHSFRYTFAWQQLDRYLASHVEFVDALKYLSRDLGHGSGRFRWVRQVYLRTHPAIVAMAGKRIT
jgi:integrase